MTPGWPDRTPLAHSPDLRGRCRLRTPGGATTYRCDQLVDDVEALRRHLNLTEIDFLAPSVQAIGALYAARCSQRINRLVRVWVVRRMPIGRDHPVHLRRCDAAARGTSP